MRVTVEYAQKHFLEIADIAWSGVTVEITRGDLPSVFLVLDEASEAEPESAGSE